MNTEGFILEVLGIFNDYDQRDELFWRTDGEYSPIKFFAKCSDLFWWGCADNEEITPETVGELRRAFADAYAAVKFGELHGASLYAARMRKLRPQGACYESIYKELWPLFDACGPERKVDIGNPKAHP